MQRFRFHPLAIGVVILALIVSFLAGQATAEPARRSIRAPVTPTDAPVTSAASVVPLALTGAETAVAVRALEMQLGVWWAAVSANQIAERDAGVAQRAGQSTGHQPGDPVTSPASAPAGGSSGTGDCTGFPIPDYIIQRESGGSSTAQNPSSGAYGCSQTLPSHYRNGGTCAGLDMYAVDGQRDCTQRLVDVAGLSPWGG